MIRKTFSVLLCLLLPTQGWPFSGRLQRKWSFKPPVGTQISWGHPLARGLIGCWLFNEGAGSVLNDLVTPRKAVVIAPQPGSWIIDSSQGTAFAGLNIANNFAQEPFPAVPMPVTIVAIVSTDNLALSASIRIMAHMDLTTNADGFAISFNTSNPAVLSWNMGGAGGVTSFSNLTISKNYTAYFTALVGFGVNGSVIGYVGEQGKPLTSQTGTLNGGNQFSQTTMTISSDDPSSGALGGKGRLSYLLYYNRALSSNEINQLNAEPYALFEPPSSNNALWFPSPATTGVVLPSMNMLGVGGLL